MLSKRTFVALLAGCIAWNIAHATAQIPEWIYFDGRTEMLFSEPLKQWLADQENKARFEAQQSKERCTGSWRDYRGLWGIISGRLYLKRMETDPCSNKPKEIPLIPTFTSLPGPVFAKWYTGTLIVPSGKQLKYVHMGYQSQYERYVVFTVASGIVVNRYETTDVPK